MVFNKVTVFLVVLGLAAVSAFPAKEAEKSEVDVPTTLRTLSDDVQDDAAVTTELAVEALADDSAAVPTTQLPVVVRTEEVKPVEVVPEVEAAVVPVVDTKVLQENVIIPVEKTAPVVVAEVVGEKVVPIVEVVEIVPAAKTGPVTEVKGAEVVPTL